MPNDIKYRGLLLEIIAMKPGSEWIWESIKTNKPVNGVLVIGISDSDHYEITFKQEDLDTYIENNIE